MFNFSHYFTSNFYALCHMPKSSVNLLVQKLRIHWWLLTLGNRQMGGGGSKNCQKNHWPFNGYSGPFGVDACGSNRLKACLHIPFTHAITALSCIFLLLTLVCWYLWKKVITSKTQRNAENACRNQMWQLSFMSSEEDEEVDFLLFALVRRCKS